MTGRPTARFLSAMAGRPALVALTGLALMSTLTVAGAQTRFTYSTGQSVSPAFEGWWPNDDGTYTLFFGYMNSNWLQELDVPIGPENSIDPGGPDHGQPTHFYPRRSPFLFTVTVPKDFGTKDLIWTLTTNGRTERAYASLKSDYQIDKQTISTEVGGDGGSLRDELRTNIPPELTVEGSSRRSVKVGAPLELVAIAIDPDNLPARRDGKPQPGVRGQTAGAGRPSRNPSAGERAQGNSANPASTASPVYNLPAATIPNSGPGLRLSWIVYRGDTRHVVFDPEQMKTWTDTRPYANSPWSPPYVIPEPPADGRWVTRVTFSAAGTYVLRAVASDGSLFTYENVSVTVER